MQLTRAHRDHYSDKSGTVHQVEHFKLPELSEKMYQRKMCHCKAKCECCF